LKGRMIQNEENPEDNSLKIKQLAIGNYILKIETNKGFYSNKLVVE
jgi:hypothetical protein